MDERDALKELAEAYGVMPTYVDGLGVEHAAPVESVLHVLAALGAPVARISDAPGALRGRVEARWSTGLRPTLAAFGGRLASARLRVPLADAGRAYALAIEGEGGELLRRSGSLQTLAPRAGAAVGAAKYVELTLPIDAALPLGRHRLAVEVGRTRHTSTVLAAPARAPALATRAWAAFLPLYALRSERGLAVGDLGDLRRLLDWAGGLGASAVGTLPLLSAYLDEPFNPSPYAPVSRRFWNELFLDVSALPELADCEEVRARLGSALVARSVETLRAEPLVDYRRAAALARTLVEPLAARALADGGPPAFRAFLVREPRAEDYATFRALTERLRAPWPRWPAPLADGVAAPSDADPEAIRYHLYVQWRLDEQLAALAAHGRRYGTGLYLDLPLGVSWDGYDTWRERTLFLPRCSLGAPPDAMFTGGQDWGLAPLHPHTNAALGHAHLEACVETQARVAGLVRLDHVMGLHRVYCVPQGARSSEGVYVRQDAEGQWAAALLAAHRAGAALVGENLGTVPPEVDAAIRRHGAHRMYVAEFRAEATEDPVPPAEPDEIAYVDTHDSFPLQGFLEGRDIDDRALLGLTSVEGAADERLTRRALAAALERFAADTPEPAPVLRALLRALGAGDAALVVVNLEDLWLERDPQNVPGTGPERPNWRRRAARTLEGMMGSGAVAAILAELARARRRSVLPPG